MMLLINIVLFAVGIVLVAVSFLTYTRKGESEISQDVLMTPKFIIGILCVIAAVIMGIFFV